MFFQKYFGTMKIVVEAPKHPNQERLVNFYTNALEKRFANYGFITKVRLKIKSIKGNKYETVLELFPKSSNTLVARANSHCENRALLQTIAKMKSQLAKYKTKRFSISLKLNKQSNQLSFIPS